MPNIPPTANAGPDQTVDESDLVTLIGPFTDPNIEDTHTAVWDWGDGSPVEPGTVVESGGTGTVTGTHIYADNGAYIVTLTVTDDDGGQATDTLTITVNNVAPSVTAGPDQVIHSGETIDVSGAFTDPGWLDTHTASWDWDDGTSSTGTVVEENVYPDSTGTVTGNHQYYLADDYTVTLKVTDKDGDEGTVTLTVEVLRIPVPIDIKPGSDPNSINTKSKGLIPVAILNDPTWTPYYIDPTDVDPSTAEFMDAYPVRWTYEDVDYDGDTDLLLFYHTPETSITNGDAEAWIEADLIDGRQIIGTDSIRTPPRAHAHL